MLDIILEYIKMVKKIFPLRSNFTGTVNITLYFNTGGIRDGKISVEEKF